MNDDDVLTLDEALEELSAAEDFLQFFGIAYDPSVVHVNRLHIMQRFHDYIDGSTELTQDHAGNDDAMKAAYQALLQRAYQDFVDSDALTEKVFKVFRTHGPQAGFVSLDSLLQG